MNPSHIILHHSLTKDSEAVSWGAIKRYHTEERDPPFLDIGYHFGIEAVGDGYQILLGRMMNVPGAHCKERGMNRISLGICFVGDYDYDEPPYDMWLLGQKLVESLMDVFKIPRENVLGHYELAPYKSCPGVRFDIERFRAQINA